VTQGMGLQSNVLFFSGKISPDLKNMISIYTKGFYEKMGTNLPDFKGFFFFFPHPKSPDFNDKFR
jgi:hypothetical protein